MKARGNEVSTIPHNKAWKQLAKTLDDEGADVVVNSAAFVMTPSVDLCETKKSETIFGNLVFPTMVRFACEERGIPLLHVSTGCLYNDNGLGHKFSESDEPMLTFDRGSGVYVSSKELAEHAVRHYRQSWLCRVRLPFDQHDSPRNYLTKLMTYPRVVDVRNSMSHRGDFVKACLDMIEMKVAFGTYNMTNPGAMFSHEICDMICKSGLKQQFEYWPLADFVKTSRKTPMSVAELDVSKLLTTGVKMRTVQEALEDSIKNWSQ